MGSDKSSTTLKGERKKTCILRKRDIKFYRKRRELPHSSGRLHLAENLSLTFRTQKNGVKNTTLNQWWTGKHICSVKVWVDIVTMLDLYPGLLDDTPVNAVWVENHMTYITSQMVTRSLRSGTLSFGEEHLVFSHNKVVSHLLR